MSDTKKYLFSIIPGNSFCDGPALELDTFYECKGTYDIMPGTDFSKVDPEFHPLNNMSDEDLKLYNEDSQTYKAMKFRMRFAMAEGLFCVVTESGFTRDNLEALLLSKFDNGKLKEFLKKAKI